MAQSGVMAMFDFLEDTGLPVTQGGVTPTQGPRVKRGVDLVLAGLLLVPLMAVALGLLVLNPFLNPGPVVFRQLRMGQGRQPFVAYKFRTMTGFDRGARGAFDAVEAARVTGFGRFLRRSRIDELPQIINVLRGEMSMIGPRPDAFAHAQQYLRDVPGYAQRCRLRPGISGYAQTEVGYVETRADLARKVAADLYYARHMSLRLDLWIVWRTLCVVLRREGR